MRRGGALGLLAAAALAFVAFVAFAASGATARSAHAGPSPAEATLADLEAVATPCPVAVAHCLGMIVHVAPGTAGGLAQGPDWLAAQVATANRLFAPLDVGFTIAGVRGLAARDSLIITRAERNRLGRGRITGGVIHVFVVERLGNVDDSGKEINGVHWRRGGKRWIILAAKAWDLTLGHEVGHFFDLPHSEVAASIMNTTWRLAPPPAERVFQPDELDRMRARLRRMLRARFLRAHAVPRGPSMTLPRPRRASRARPRAHQSEIADEATPASAASGQQ